MKRRIELFILLTIILNLFLIGCGNNNGKEYLGTWVNSQYAKETLEITRNGDNFIVTQVIPNLLSFKKGNMKRHMFAAVYKDNQLIISTGLGPMTVSYVKKDGTLLFNGKQYNHLK